jgi:hypothetical protein
VSDGTYIKPPALLAQEARIPGSRTAGTKTEKEYFDAPQKLIDRSYLDQNVADGLKTSSSVLNTLQPKSMVQYRCGHGSNPPYCSIAVQQHGPCHVLFYFSTIRVRVCWKTHI